jgi:hypothetical protein
MSVQHPVNPPEMEILLFHLILSGFIENSISYFIKYDALFDGFRRIGSNACRGGKTPCGQGVAVDAILKWQ